MGVLDGETIGALAVSTFGVGGIDGASDMFGALGVESFDAVAVRTLGDGGTYDAGLTAHRNDYHCCHLR